MGEEQSNRETGETVQKQTRMMRRHIRAVYTAHKGDWTGNLCMAVSCSPPPILSPRFCSISFITVSWLRNQAIVQLLDHEGQQYFHCGFDAGRQSADGPRLSVRMKSTDIGDPLTFSLATPFF